MSSLDEIEEMFNTVMLPVEKLNEVAQEVETKISIQRKNRKWLISKLRDPNLISWWKWDFRSIGLNMNYGCALHMYNRIKHNSTYVVDSEMCKEFGLSYTDYMNIFGFSCTRDTYTDSSDYDKITPLMVADVLEQAEYIHEEFEEEPVDQFAELDKLITKMEEFIQKQKDSHIFVSSEVVNGESNEEEPQTRQECELVQAVSSLPDKGKEQGSQAYQALENAIEEEWSRLPHGWISRALSKPVT